MKSPRRGFSLVLSLAVMGLLVLVLLSVAGFLTLESRIAASTAAGRQARLNAVASARLALAQLQLLAGNDQRVTARADLFDPAAAGTTRNTYLSSLSPAATLNADRRWWTGVWMTGTGGRPADKRLRLWDPATPDTRLCVGWLVSPAPAPSTEALQLTPASDLATATANAVAVAPRKVLVESGVPLLGVRDLGFAAGATPLVKRPPYALPEGGSIAWWTADEGVKARVNLHDPLMETAAAPAAVPTGVNAWWKAFRLTAFGQSGAEPTTATSATAGLREAKDEDLRAAIARGDTPDAAGLSRARSRADLQAWAANPATTALDAAAKETLATGLGASWHDVTAVSRGILTNTLDGGLKVDLSVAFELPYATVGAVKGWKDLTCFPASPEKNEPNLLGDLTNTTDPGSAEWNNTDLLRYVFEVPVPDEESRGRALSPHVLRGPTWDLLRNHYRLYKREAEAGAARATHLTGSGFAVAADSWVARGSTPYTFVQGSTAQRSTVTTVIAGGGTLPTSPTPFFGPKANLSVLQPDATTSAAQPRHARPLTLADGQTRARPQDTAARLAPHVTRAGMVHSLIYCDNTLAIGLDPFVAVHNPYDVPLQFMGVGVSWTQFNNVRFNIRRSDTPGTVTATCGLGQDRGSRRTYMMKGFDLGSGAWKTAPQGLLRIEPGETRILTPNFRGDRWQIEPAANNMNHAMGGFAYDLLSNFRINAYTPGTNQLIRENKPLLDSLVASVANPGTSEPLVAEMTVDEPSAANGNFISAFDLVLFRGNRHYGQVYSPGYRSWMDGSSVGNQDHSDEHLLQRIAYRSSPAAIVGSETPGVVRSQPFVRSTAVDRTGSIPDKRFFAITELRLRSAAETNGFPLPTLAFNPRAQLADPRNWDGKSAAAPGWQASIKPLSGDPLTELQFWPGNVPEKNQASWGDSHFPGSGTRTTILFQVPRRPLVALAQLTHADIGEVDLDPAYAIGNSYAHPGLDALDKVLHWPAASGTGSPLERLDLSYAANLGLWDRAFFSGLNGGTAAAADGTAQPHATLQAAVDALLAGSADALANRRLRLWAGRTDAPATATEATAAAAAAKRAAALLDPSTTARQLMQEGTFNVNSTSVAAWKAQLAGGFGALAEGLTKRPDHPFSRLHPPAGESLESGETNRWRTYRSLAAGGPALDRLAEAIVEEVRARGPFMCLADFVNRRLKGDENGRKGSLQAAIDEAGLNPDIVATAIGSTALTRLPQAAALAASGVPAEAPLALGRPDMVLQSDVLAAIGPHLSARSDTFVIRAYGEHKGAGAWCEVTVQRTPDWIAPQAAESTVADPDYRTRIRRTKGEVADMSERNPALSAVNLALGRRFVVTDFRWIPAP